MGKVTNNTIILSFITLLTLPLTIAYTGISPLDTGLTLLGNLFSFNALQNETVALGIARLAWFILLFAVFAYAARKVFSQGDNAGLDKKTAHIVAFVIAAISTFFTPMNVLMTATTGYAAFVWSLIVVGPAIFALYFAFGRQEARGDDVSTGQRAIELVILGAGFLWTTMMMGTLVQWIQDQFPEVSRMVEAAVGYMTLIMLLAIIVKLFQMLGAGKWSLGGSTDSSGPGTRDETGSGRDKSSRSKDPSARRPSKPTGLAGELIAPDTIGDETKPSELVLWWNPNAQEEGVTHYEVYYQQYPKYGIGYTGTTGWHKIGSTKEATIDHPFRANIPEKAVRELALRKKGSMLVGVRAVNNKTRSWMTKAYIYQHTEKRYFTKIIQDIRAMFRGLETIRTNLQTVRAEFDNYHQTSLPPAAKNIFINETMLYTKQKSKVQELFKQIFGDHNLRSAADAELNEIITLFSDFQLLDAEIIAIRNYIGREKPQIRQVQSGDAQ